ncbi:hypothetical protein CKK33_10975 [Mucilaginibacter sp. MD40]|uniref:phage tail protein n=1 Tax=Mucilaginibacter sp. MD40 TaxID=2029590 RepID=UPI000BAC89AE|nr:tail fiber protein [Mucilaginibacter sp. MD40]PAW93989.1 hypothetical protein CKK33_10975 [Mucilaginibacter sp. MD40]
MEPLVGEIKLFAGNFAPQGWFFCDGTTLPISRYQALFSLLGTMYGGDGYSNFQLPDLRGTVPLHVGNGGSQSGVTVTLGERTGSASVKLSVTQLPPHTHSIYAVSVGDKPQPNGNYLSALPVDPNTGEGSNNYADGSPDSVLNAGSVTSTGGGLPFDIVQPSLGVNYIIAYEGIYPPRP